MHKQEVKLTYTLKSVNLHTKTGVLHVKQEHLSKGKNVQVQLSGQLAGRIKFAMKNPSHPKAMKLVNVDFTSTLCSPSFEENPFKLVKFSEEGKEDRFQLQFVTDKGFTFTPYVNAMNQRVNKIKYLKWHPKQYMRFYPVLLTSK